MNCATRLALGLPVRDASGACRAYRVELLRQLDFSQLTATGYAYLEEILWQLSRRGARFAEVPIAFADRRAGASKVHAGEALGKARVLARLAWQRVTGCAPLAAWRVLPARGSAAQNSRTARAVARRSGCSGCADDAAAAQAERRRRGLHLRCFGVMKITVPLAESLAWPTSASAFSPAAAIARA